MESLEHKSRPLSSLFSRGEAVTIAILPQNSIDYSSAAGDAGADAVVVGIDKTESNLPGLFGGFDLMEDSINTILSTSSIPVGISIGDSRPLGIENWERIISKPFSFVNMYAHHMPTFVLEDTRIGKLVSIGPGYMLEQVKSIAEFDEIVALEAAIVPPQGRNHIFSALDIATLRVLSNLSSKPLLLRSQKRMAPEELRTSIERAGLKGVCIDPSALEPGVEAYRDAISTFRSRGITPARTVP